MFDMQFCNCQNGWKNPLKLSADYIHNEFRSYKTTDFDSLPPMLIHRLMVCMHLYTSTANSYTVLQGYFGPLFFFCPSTLGNDFAWQDIVRN